MGVRLKRFCETRCGTHLDPILADSLLCHCLKNLKWKTTIQKCVGNICKLEFTPVKMDKAGVYSGQYFLSAEACLGIVKHPTCFEAAVACYLNENTLLKLEHAPAAGACSGTCLSHKHVQHAKNTSCQLRLASVL